jgi:plasmid rolling circle replication initiator protein Rep
MEAIARDKVPVRYVYLTLTVRNCEGRNLGKALDALNDGWQRLSELKRVKDVMLGWYKAIEITHNTTYDSPDYNTFHPHIHAVLAVQPSYFGRGYIRQADWTSMWAKSMRIKYDPIVDVRRVKGATARAVAEAAGYAVKSSDYIVPEDWELTEYTVRLLDEVLHHRRLIGFGGLLREYHRKLHQDDPEDGDLIHITGDEVTKEEAELTYYAWSTGYRQYREVSKDGLMA